MSDGACLVVFGLDPEDRPRAAYFIECEADLAAKAARHLGYRSLRIAEAELANGLPRGDVFARGRAFVRRVSRRTFDTLCAAAGKPARVQQARGRDGR
jgi:hypothetical protein